MILYPHAQVSGDLSTLPGENTKSASCIKAPQVILPIHFWWVFPQPWVVSSHTRTEQYSAKHSVAPFCSFPECSLLQPHPLWYLALQILDALAFWTAVSDFSTQSVFCLGSLPCPFCITTWKLLLGMLTWFVSLLSRITILH